MENNVLISVIDDGIGMGESRIRDILENNLTSSLRGTEKEKGTGPGIFISREFLEKHNSKLCISSEPGKGTTVSFMID